MLHLFSNIQIWSFVDILMIWLLIYQFAKLVRGTRAEQVMIGIFVVSLSFILSTIIPLATVRWILGKVSTSLLIITVILFQDEIKAALSKLGKTKFLSHPENQKAALASSATIDEIVRATSILEAQKMGALIVIEKNIILNRYVEVGVEIDSVVTHQILTSIFHPTSPIHDGAVIIKGGRIAVAGCFLPLSQSSKLALHMGTRHRAGFGISEQTDAVVILVSEERGSIHLIYDGHIENNLSAPGLKQRLVAHSTTGIYHKPSKQKFYSYFSSRKSQNPPV